MIIYKAQQNRYYPIISKSFFRKYCNTYLYRSIYNIFDLKNEEQALKEKIILYPTESKIVRSKNDSLFLQHFHREPIIEERSNQDIDFIYGIFNVEKVDKRSHDFCFTFLEDPIENVYHLYNYIKHTLIHKVKNFETIELYEFVEKTRQDMGTWTMLKKFECYKSIEEFIDEFIFSKGKIEFIYNNIKFSFIDDFFKILWAKEMDFIGIANNENNLFRSIDILHKKLHIEKLDMDNYKSYSSLTKPQHYRKKDIYNLLQEESEFYKEIESRLSNE